MNIWNDKFVKMSGRIQKVKALFFFPLSLLSDLAPALNKAEAALDTSFCRKEEEKGIHI